MSLGLRYGVPLEVYVSKFAHMRFEPSRMTNDPDIRAAKSIVDYIFGIAMTECRLLEEGGRRHFMTRRFDREDDGGKRHMQSLGELAHYDFNQPGAYSYEQALQVIRRLGLPMEAIEQQFRRMAFNIVARNKMTM